MRHLHSAQVNARTCGMVCPCFDSRLRDKLRAIWLAYGLEALFFRSLRDDGGHLLRLLQHREMTCRQRRSRRGSMAPKISQNCLLLSILKTVTIRMSTVEDITCRLGVGPS